MITINIKKIIATTLSAVTMMSTVMFAPLESFDNVSTIMSVTAQTNLSKPVLSKKNIYSNKIEIKVDNLSSYSNSTKFRVYVGSAKVKTVKYSTLAKKNLISIYDNGSKFLKAKTTYKIKVVAVDNGETITSKTISVKTDSNTYYKIPSETKLFTLQNGKYKVVGYVSKIQYVRGILCASKGTRVAGKSISDYNANYVLINEGEYKGKYVKLSTSDTVRTTEKNAKIQTVVNYAIGMNGGRYVWGGESYGATDCSGLTMLSYKQIGINITHSAYQQAKCGKASSMSKIKTGDVIICNNYGHVALYIGNGKIIHAMNSYYGIRIQPVANIKYCGSVNAVRSIVY